jgi:hypothetical protein
MDITYFTSHMSVLFLQTSASYNTHEEVAGAQLEAGGHAEQEHI